MAQENIKLTKKVYDKQSVNDLLNASFSELGNSNNSTSNTNLRNRLNQLFTLYNDLFYEIPKEGDVNSHEFLIKQSTEYVGAQGISDEMQALFDEITVLREENLELQQNIIDLTTDDNINSTS